MPMLCDFPQRHAVADETEKSQVPDCSASSVQLSRLLPHRVSGGRIRWISTTDFREMTVPARLAVWWTCPGGRCADDQIGRTWSGNPMCTPWIHDYRLMAKGDEVKQTITWPGRVRTGSECRRNRTRRWGGPWRVFGAAFGRASKAKSDPVGITVE